MTRVAIIGNAGGGKSTLARRLGGRLGLPVFQVDQVQWLPGWQPAPAEVIAAAFAGWLAQPGWIIDGWGSLADLAERFERADTIILADFPLAVHYWWAMKRQAHSVLRPGGDWPPPGCQAWPVTGRLIRLMWRVHRELRPQVLALVDGYRPGRQVVILNSPAQLRRFMATEC